MSCSLFWTLPESEIVNFHNYKKWKNIQTLTWIELKNKYKFVFDVLVVDAEGGLFHIIKDEPTFFQDFRLVIMENDHKSIEHKIEIDELLRKQVLN